MTASDVKLIWDECADGRVLNAVRARAPELQILTVREAGLSGATDAAIVQWAAANGVAIVTMDRSTMPVALNAHLELGLEHAGAFIFDLARTSPGRVADALLAAILRRSSTGLTNVVIFL